MSPSRASIRSRFTTSSRSSLVSGTEGIGVLISDHNVEQTLDIVDRAYIMFDGQVKVSGTVRELVFDDEVSRIYLGPTLTARLRARFATEGERPVRHGTQPEHLAPAGAEDQSTPVPGDGPALHAAARPAAAPEAGAADQSVPRDDRAGRGRAGSGGRERGRGNERGRRPRRSADDRAGAREGKRRDRLGRDPPRRLRHAGGSARSTKSASTTSRSRSSGATSTITCATRSRSST